MTDDAAVDVVETEIEDVVTDEIVTEEVEADPLDPLDQWPADFRDQWAKIADFTGEGITGRDIQQRFIDMTKENESKFGELGQRLDKSNRQYQSFQDVVDRHEQTITRAGMAPHAAIDHSLGFLKLATQDPQAAIEYIAKNSRVDLAKMVEDKPYVDPAVSELQKKYDELEAKAGREEQDRRQAFLGKMQETATAFEDEKDENGKLKHPHLSDPDVRKRVLRDALADVQANQLPDYAKHYERACWTVETVRNKMIAAQTPKPSQVETVAQKAKAASTTVKGSGKGNVKKPLGSVRDSIDQAREQLS